MMEKSPYMRYICTNESFRRPPLTVAVRWLDWEQDYDLARDFWGPTYRDSFRDIWDEIRDLGYEYCAVIGPDGIRSRAGVWRFSDTAWDCAAVYTKEEYQRRGYGKAVCAFVTSYILESGRIATCGARENNLPMQKTAESLGYFSPTEDYPIQWSLLPQ